MCIRLGGATVSLKGHNMVYGGRWTRISYGSVRRKVGSCGERERERERERLKERGLIVYSSYV